MQFIQYDFREEENACRLEKWVSAGFLRYVFCSFVHWHCHSWILIPEVDFSVVLWSDIKTVKLLRCNNAYFMTRLSPWRQKILVSRGRFISVVESSFESFILEKTKGKRRNTCVYESVHFIERSQESIKHYARRWNVWKLLKVRRIVLWCMQQILLV